MSFLQQLQAKKGSLRSTETMVRYADGSRVVHGRDGQTVSAAAYGYVVDTAPDTIAACVLGDWLYVGSQDAVSTDLSRLYGITHLLSIGIEAPLPTPLLQTLFVPCLDLPETNLLAVLSITDPFIGRCRADGGRVLVHCNAGVSRSVAVVLGYLMRSERMSYDGALAVVKSVRSCCRPNEGFAKQLREME